MANILVLCRTCLFHTKKHVQWVCVITQTQTVQTTPSIEKQENKHYDVITLCTSNDS